MRRAEVCAEQLGGSVGSSPRRTRPDAPPVEADDLLRQATDGTSAADPEEEATAEAETEPSEDEIKVLREHFRRQGRN